MQARDIMAKPVLTAKPATTVADIASLMAEKRISGLPIVDEDGNLVGVVSETDLLHRSETGTERRRKWWMRILLDSETLARDYVKTHGKHASDIMSPYVISVSADADLRHVADVLDKNEIKRVPVLDNGKLVGIITRGDLVRALAANQPQPSAEAAGDAALQQRIMAKVQSQSWLNPTYLSITATNGVVESWGFIASEAQRAALRVLVEEAGAKGYKDNLKVGLARFHAA